MSQWMCCSEAHPSLAGGVKFDASPETLSASVPSSCAKTACSAGCCRVSHSACDWLLLTRPWYIRPGVSYQRDSSWTSFATNCSIARTASAQTSGGQTPSTTSTPSRWYSASCAADSRICLLAEPQRDTVRGHGGCRLPQVQCSMKTEEESGLPQPPYHTYRGAPATVQYDSAVSYSPQPAGVLCPGT